MNIDSKTINTIQLCFQELGLQLNAFCLKNRDDSYLWSFCTKIYTSVSTCQYLGAGADFSDTLALIKATSESMERYFLYSPNNILDRKTSPYKHLHCLPEER